MKRIISLILACMMIFGALALSSCRPIEPTGDSSQTTTQGTAATTAPQAPVPVDSLNGKNAKQLFEKFFSDYKNSKSFDLSMSMTTTEEGETLTENIEIKLTETEMYMDMSMDGTDMKIWLVGGVVYVDMGGEKYKSSNADIGDILGDGFIDEIVSTIPIEFPEAYMKKVEAAQIYSHKGAYYFSVSVTAAEAEQMDLGDEGYVETIYFNAAGEVTRVFDRSIDAKNTMTLNLNSYGKKVTITPPANPDSFVDQTPQASAEYATYEQLREVLTSATAYSVVWYDDELYMSYETDGEGEHILANWGSNVYEIWYIDGQYYLSRNGEAPLETLSLNGEAYSAYQESQGINKILDDLEDGGSINDIATVNMGDSKKMMTFEFHYPSGDEFLENVIIFVSITYDCDFTNIDISMNTQYNGEPIGTTNFHFSSINLTDLNITAPV